MLAEFTEDLTRQNAFGPIYTEVCCTQASDQQTSMHFESYYHYTCLHFDSLFIATHDACMTGLQ